jgi:hypothetical protein
MLKIHLQNKEYMIYEINEVKKGRIDKYCSNEECDKLIPKGTPHFRVTCENGGYYNLTACSEECIETIRREL